MYKTYSTTATTATTAITTTISLTNENIFHK